MSDGVSSGAAAGGEAVVDVRTADKARVPPGQSLTRKWPVLHYGGVPRVDLATCA